jgi:hypothetical protein
VTPKETSEELIPLAELERKILADFAYLFPTDIPAVLTDAGTLEHLSDSPFPEKMQDKASRIRHKIVLTDPDTVINEQQYPYPQKHLVVW